MALGKKNGYQHLWLKGQATPEKGLAKVSWLNENGRFYTQTSLVNGDESFMFTQIGANDPNWMFVQYSASWCSPCRSLKK